MLIDGREWKLVPVEPTAEMVGAACDEEHRPLPMWSRMEAIYAAMLAAAPDVQGEPVGWQFYQDGKWWHGDDRIKDHRKNTEEAGYLIRDVYAAPQPAEQQPAEQQPGWYCAHCQRGVDAREVTYSEQLEVCGRYIANDDPPPPSALVGVRCGECRGTGEVCTGTIDGTPELFDCDQCGGTGNSLAQQPAAAGEEIMVNTPYDVFTLPLQPSGLGGKGPRFVVHVPGSGQPAAPDVAALVEALELARNDLKEWLKSFPDASREPTGKIIERIDAAIAANRKGGE